MKNEFGTWAINQHKETNHYYDRYIPYEFHLRMVVLVGQQFSDLVKTVIFPQYCDKYPMVLNYDRGYNGKEEALPNLMREIEMALFGHDLIEDCRVSYGDIQSESNVYVAELIRAMTNDPRGRNRDERNNQEYYDGLKAIPGGVFCKLCDRIANVKYSILTQSRMTEKYRKENVRFREQLYIEELKPMFDYLDNLFDNNQF